MPKFLARYLPTEMVGRGAIAGGAATRRDGTRHRRARVGIRHCGTVQRPASLNGARRNTQTGCNCNLHAIYDSLFWFIAKNARSP